MAIKKGDVVEMDYEGRFEDGEVFDSSAHGDHSHPLRFKAGGGEVIPGVDEAVIGMEAGEEKEVILAPLDAYGDYDPLLKKEIPRDALPADKEPEPGMALFVRAPDGREFPINIIEVNEESVTIDLNHPLAGKTLIFKIKILTIK